MTRNEFVHYLISEARRLVEEENLYSLMRCKDYLALELLKDGLEVHDIFSIDGYYIALEADEIPSKLLIAVTFIITANDFSDNEIFKDWKKFGERLGEEGGELGKSIAAEMHSQDLRYFDVEDFLDESFADEYYDYYEN